MKKTFLLFILALGMSYLGWGQVSLTTLGSAYTQDFNTLAITGTTNTWTDNSTIAGWYSDRVIYIGDNGSNTTGGLHSYGTTSTTERALGSLSSGSASPLFAVRLINNTGGDVTSFAISYKGEQWRQTINAYILVFEYQVGATSISSGTWTAFTALNFTALKTGTAGPLDGNASGNYATISSTIGTTVSNGQEIWLRWSRTGSSSPGLGVDDFSVTPLAPVITNYYSASSGSGNLELTTSWGTNTNGTGSNPSNFTTDYQVFNIRNNATQTIGGNWTVSGTGSKVVLGDGTNAVNFTIPSSYSLTGTIDLSASSTLTIQNSTIPTFGTCNASSITVYDGTVGQIITPTTYSNLTLSSPGTKTFAGNTTTVSGNLIINNTTLDAPSIAPFATLNLGGNLTYLGTVTPPVDGNSITLTTTGTGTQTITGNGNIARWFRLQTTNSGNNVVLSETGGSTNLNVGNASSGGISLVNGSLLTLNGNTLTFIVDGDGVGNGTITGGNGTITCNTSSNIMINKNGASAFGTLRLTSGSETLNNLTLNMIGAGNTVILGSPVIVNGNLTITNGNLNVPAGGELTVNGTTTISGALVLQSPTSTGRTGSFLPIGAVTGSVTVERYIPQYTSDADGWYFLSSPVSGQSIDPNFDPAGSTYDFYRWKEIETTTPWINYKGGSFLTFTAGEGYLVAYAVSSTKTFTGSINPSNITLTNQSFTGASSWSGWHLLGNPFTCSVEWNDGNWGLSNVEAVAQIMNTGGTYHPLGVTDPIPAMNGFMVHATTGTNSLTIPLDARAHNSDNWYKSVANVQDKLLLTAASTDNTTYVESIVQFNPEATPAFDMAYDGHFLSGIAAAPQLYSIVGDEQLCVNTLPQIDNTRTVPLGFVKGNSVNYTMNVTGLESFNPGVSVSLEDTKVSKTQDLRQSPVYSFSAAAGDNTNRFLLHFGGLFGVNELNKDNAIQIYSFNNTIYIANNSGQQVKGQVFVYNLMGQQLMQHELGDNKLTTLNLSGSTGYYLVKVITGENSYSGKVFLR
jgi:hypothetical protein